MEDKIKQRAEECAHAQMKIRALFKTALMSLPKKVRKMKAEDFSESNLLQAPVISSFWRKAKPLAVKVYFGWSTYGTAYEVYFVKLNFFGCCLAEAVKGGQLPISC